MNNNDLFTKHRLQTTCIFALAALGMYFGASVAGSLLFMNMPYAESILSIFLYVAGLFLPCAVYVLLLKARSGQRVMDTLSFRRLPFISVLLCVLLGFLIQPVTALIAQAASLVFQDITTIAITQESAATPLWLMLLSTALLPALFEEILCRGVLYDGCKDAPLWYQLVIPACFFGFLHMNFQQISYALPMGIFLAIILYLTGSIFSTMIIHFVVNGTQVTCAWLNENLGIFDRGHKMEDLFITFIGGHADIRITAVIALCSAALIGAVIFLLCRIHNTGDLAKRQVQRGWHEGGWIMGLIIGFLFLTALIMEIMMPFMADLI